MDQVHNFLMTQDLDEEDLEFLRAAVVDSSISLWPEIVAPFLTLEALEAFSALVPPAGARDDGLQVVGR
jgi:hypothetical protein